MIKRENPEKYNIRVRVCKQKIHGSFDLNLQGEFVKKPPYLPTKLS